MKRVLSIVVAVVLIASMSSCTTTIDVVSKSAYLNTIAEVNQQLAENGYEMTGMSEENKNEVSVSGVSYSRYLGYGSAMKNNYWQYNEFSFTDSLKNEVSYTVKYQLKTDEDGLEYVDNLEMTNCVSSKNYNAICGSEGIVRKNINQTINNPDAKAEIPYSTGAILGITFGALGACTIALIILCLL